MESDSDNLFIKLKTEDEEKYSSDVNFSDEIIKITDDVGNIKQEISTEEKAGNKNDSDKDESEEDEEEEDDKDETTGSKRLVCKHPGCNRQFSRPSRLLTHSRIHTGERPFVCEMCNKSYARNAHLKRHISTNHSKTKPLPELFICSTCDKSFTLKHNLQKHIKRSHDEDRFKCDKCDEGFSKHRLLKAHKAVHGEGTGCWSCTQCKKTFPSQSKLKKHKRAHAGYKCDECDVLMEKWSDLLMHKKSHLAEPGASELIQCDKCEKQFSRRYMKMHRQIHDEERPVLHCPKYLCPRYFYFLRNLKQHLNSFHLDVKFQCTVSDCNLSLTSKQRLQRHIQSKHSDNIKDVKQKSKARARKDRGVFKKPIAAVLTRLEVENGQELMKQKEKVPLQDIDSIRAEAKEFIGSNLETSDSEGFVPGGCRRITNKPYSRKIKRFPGLPAAVSKLMEDDEDQNESFKVFRVGELSSDTDTDRELEPKLVSPMKPDFSAFVK